jgi:hypothetical protein
MIQTRIMKAAEQKDSDIKIPSKAKSSEYDTFILLKLEDYEYYVIRCHFKYVDKAICKRKSGHPNLEVTFIVPEKPNSKSLYSRLKERLSHSGVKFSYNNITLENPNSKSLYSRLSDSDVKFSYNNITLDKQLDTEQDILTVNNLIKIISELNEEKES